MVIKADGAPRLKGMTFARAAIAVALAEGSKSAASEIAAARWGATSPATAYLKSAVGAGTSDTWRPESSPYSASAEFFAAAFERSIAGRLAGLRRVPFLTRMVNLADATQASWVAEGAAVPISAAALDFSALPPLKVAAMTVCTLEALRETSGLAEATLRADLLRAVTDALDAAFLDPTNAGVPDAKPASITNGAPSTDMSSTWDAEDLVYALVDGFEGDLASAVVAVNPKTAALLHSPLKLPNLGARGGDVAGIPAVVSRGMPLGEVALIDPLGIAYAGGSGEIKVSTEATVEMDDAPTADATTPTATQSVSLWQSHAAALGCSAFANWRTIREGYVTRVMTPVTGAS